MRQMFSIGERSGLQAGQFSTRTILLRSHSVSIAAVCGFALSCWNKRHLERNICCSKTFICLSAFIMPSKTCKLSIPYALMHHLCHQRRWLLNWTLIKCWKISLFFRRSTPAAISPCSPRPVAHWSKAGLSLVSTWMGDLLGKLGCCWKRC